MAAFLSIGRLCGHYRKTHLNIPQSELERRTGFHQKTMSSFENGRSQNPIHVKHYIKLMDEDTRVEFGLDLIQTLESI